MQPHDQQPAAGAAATRWGGRHRRLRRKKEGAPARVVPFLSYGTRDRVVVRGFVLHGEPPPEASADDSWWLNLANAYRRIGAGRIPGARVRVCYQDAETVAVTDGRGHFHASLEARTTPGDQLWYPARVHLLDPPGEPATALVAIPAGARFGIVSDLDDTVLHTDATSLLRMAREVLFRNAHTRIPLPGVGAFYRALHRSGGYRNPVFYVSSGPWPLYDMVREFLQLHRIPAGPIELRDWGFTSRARLPTRHRTHKLAVITEILDTYPHLPFILVGDSGQEDPEIYREIVHRHPERILAIYIRSVVNAPGRVEAVNALAEEVAAARGPGLVLVDDTLQAARHAAAQGWITTADLDDIERLRDAEA
jgi:phosphatidate phosphatase APP1